MSPTARSLALLRSRGYLAEVVEKWIPRANIRKDLWGWCDVLAVHDFGFNAVQCTTYANVSARVRKIKESDTFARVRPHLYAISVHGWKKNKQGRWECREVVV